MYRATIVFVLFLVVFSTHFVKTASATTVAEVSVYNPENQNPENQNPENRNPENRNPENLPVKLRVESYLRTVITGDVPMQRRWYPAVAGDEVIGTRQLRYLIQGTETLVELARVFDLGFNEIQDANAGVNVWLPTAGTLIRGSFRFVLPLTPARIVINLPEMRLYHKRPDGWVDTYPVGIGREGLDTPLGTARVVRKKQAPSWYVPASIRLEKPSLPAVVPPGPENPLGTHAVYLSMSGYLIHGTQEPYGIGRRVSHGCMRLYPEDIVRFYEEVSANDSVAIVSQPIKAGWQGNQLFLEVHNAFSKKEQVQLGNRATTVINQALFRRKGHEKVVLDWPLVNKMVRQADGIPQVIGKAHHPSSLRLRASHGVFNVEQ